MKIIKQNSVLVLLFLETLTGCYQNVQKSEADVSFTNARLIEPPEVSMVSYVSRKEHLLSPEIEARFMSMKKIVIPRFTQDRFELYEHTLLPGENLATLSHKYSVPIEDIIANNKELNGKAPIKQKNTLITEKSRATNPKILLSHTQNIQEQAAELKKLGLHGDIQDKKNKYHIEPGKPLSSLKTLFTESQLSREQYQDKKGLHERVSIMLSNKKQASLEVYATQKNGMTEPYIHKVVIKDPSLLVNETFNVGISIEELQKNYPHMEISMIQDAIVVFPEKTEPVAMVLEGFSMEWKANNNYSIQDIPKNVRVRSIQLF